MALYYVITTIYPLTCDLLIRELILELVSIQIELSDHFINLFNMSLQPFLILSYPLVPEHRVISLYVLLRHQYITAHFQVGATGLTCQHVTLAFHEGKFYL